MSDKPEKKKIERLYTSKAQYTSPERSHVSHGTSLPKEFTLAERVSLKSGFNRWDKDLKRPEDALPRQHKDIIITVQAMYRKVGMVRNIIDLMADFASEGLQLQHPVKSQERFFNRWAEKVDLSGRAHDFMKNLLRDGNVVVRRKRGIITLPVVKEMSKAFRHTSFTNILTRTDLDESMVDDVPDKILKDKKSRKRVIPWHYVFLSPAVVEKISGAAGRFFGDDSLGMRIPLELTNSIKSPKTDSEKAFVEKLPAEIVNAIRNGNNVVALNREETYVDYYKKDDWEDWGTPFMYGVLEDILLKEKMRLADMSALDGVINVIRLWKLGKSDQNIFPTTTAVNRLIEILENNPGGGVMELVWDDMIDLQVEYPPTDKILGTEKYDSVNADIMRGLGIPDALISGNEFSRSGDQALIQLKALAEKLEYVRERCMRWLKNELTLVADAMRFNKIPNIVFGTMSTRDEAAEKQLLIQLLDRGVVSSESVQKAFDHDFLIELSRLRNEEKIRSKEMPILEKANPYYRPRSVMELQQQFTVELADMKQNEPEGNEQGGDLPREESVDGPGRPPNSRDTGPRDERTDKTLSIYKVMAEEYLDKIDKIIDPKYLGSKNAKNLRSLTKDQKNELELIKRVILAGLRPDDEVNDALIRARLGNDLGQLPDIFNKVFESLKAEHIELRDKMPNLGERRSLSTSTWAILFYKGED